MTVRRILVAVDDSPAALRAADFAMDLANGWQATLRLVTVITDHTVGRLLEISAFDGGAADRVEQAGVALLRHIGDTARSRGLDVDTVELVGEPFRQIVDQAQAWRADLIVMGLSDRTGPSSPYLGSVTAHVLEFAECPVLVVPGRSTSD